MSKIKTHWVDWCKNDPVDSGWCALLLAHLQWLWVTSEASSSFSRCSCSASQCQRKSRPWYTLLYIHSQYVWNDALHRVHERPALFSSNLNSMQYNRKCMHVQYAVGLNKLKIYYTTNKLVSTRLTVSRRSRNWAPLGPSWANHRNGTIFIARQRIIIIIFYLPWK